MQFDKAGAKIPLIVNCLFQFVEGDQNSLRCVYVVLSANCLICYNVIIVKDRHKCKFVYFMIKIQFTFGQTK